MLKINAINAVLACYLIFPERKSEFFSKKVARKFGGKKIKLYFCNEIKNEMITNLK